MSSLRCRIQVVGTSSIDHSPPPHPYWKWWPQYNLGTLLCLSSGSPEADPETRIEASCSLERWCQETLREAWGIGAGQAANKVFLIKLVAVWITGAWFHERALETRVRHTGLSHLGLMPLRKEGYYVNSWCILLICSAHRQRILPARDADVGSWRLASVH